LIEAELATIKELTHKLASAIELNTSYWAQNSEKSMAGYKAQHDTIIATYPTKIEAHKVRALKLGELYGEKVEFPKFPQYEDCPNCGGNWEAMAHCHLSHTASKQWYAGEYWPNWVHEYGRDKFRVTLRGGDIIVDIPETLTTKMISHAIAIEGRHADAKSEWYNDHIIVEMWCRKHNLSYRDFLRQKEASLQTT
jgi:hypothetical protein